VRALNLVLRLVPDALKLAVIVGMGLLLSFVGLQVRKRMPCMDFPSCFCLVQNWNVPDSLHGLLQMPWQLQMHWLRLVPGKDSTIEAMF
jgi:hypothetical protein